MILFNKLPHEKVLALLGLLAMLNISAWLLAIWAFRGFPLLLGTCVIAYGFGLRHAVDADHIAAIDNVTRKLMQQGQRPVAVGFFFSLGHSTVVVLASIAVVLATTTVRREFPQFREIGSLIGTSVSATFLLVIALINLVILRDIHRAYQEVKRGGKCDDTTLTALVANNGIVGRFFRPLFRLIERSWHMYPLGFLFGLGFDTATEIGLLGITATEATKGLSTWSILIFPALFTVGMCLVDTADGVLMLAAYGWAYLEPLRKLSYNMTITFVSVLAAVLVGGLEVLSILGDKFELQGRFWSLVEQISRSSGAMGYFIIGILIVGWLASAIVHKRQRASMEKQADPSAATGATPVVAVPNPTVE